MQTRAQHEVHAIPTHDDKTCCDDTAREHTEVLYPAGYARVKKCYVTEQRDKCPSFFWIPAPESAPRIVGPDSAQNDSRRQKNKTDLHCALCGHRCGADALSVD